ncbi:MAG: acyl-CoA dehydratase activase [Spirochaetes bacterium]|nr:acyl-CoA dehydratase activase [Spirochaetota bacterium]
MITAGCDVGSLTAKAVLMEGDEIRSFEVIRVYASPEKSAREVMERMLSKVGMKFDDIECCVGTGYGRKHIGFVKGVESEIACHARGAFFMNPNVRTVIDIGGQDAKAIKVDQQGNVSRYVYNDKCASGTGRFLEIIADALEVPLEKLGELSKKSTEFYTLSNQCVIFAETEIISLVNDGKDIPDIVAALHRAVANRIAALAKSISVETEVVMTGGVAKNEGMFEALQQALGVEIKSVPQPQIMGAIGAALFARDLLVRT